MADGSTEHTGDSPEPFVSYALLLLKKSLILSVITASLLIKADKLLGLFGEPEAPQADTESKQRCSLSQDPVISHNDNHNILKACPF